MTLLRADSTPGRRVPGRWAAASLGQSAAAAGAERLSRVQREGEERWAEG